MAPLPPVAPPRPKVREIAARLAGYCIVDESDVDALTIEECRELDLLVFKCVGCEWWHEKSECVDLPRGWFCRECAAEDSSG